MADDRFRRVDNPEAWLRTVALNVLRRRHHLGRGLRQVAHLRRRGRHRAPGPTRAVSRVPLGAVRGRLRRARPLAGAGALAAATLLLAGCTGDPPSGARPSTPLPTVTTRAGPLPSGSATPPAATARPGDRTDSPLRADDVRPGSALRVVRHLAGFIGPRHATSPSFRRAVSWVSTRFRRAGYDVRLQPFPVPGGVSWGVPVAAGRSVNVLAAPAGFEPRRPHLVVGAHLDTVPQAPGAEDNASGVGVLLAVAEAASVRRTRLPVLFVAFGAEEPRGPTDDDHHYGSRHYVAGLGRDDLRAVRAMVALDRVGVGRVVPVCSAGSGRDPLRARVLAAARRARVPATSCDGNRASDHWSFVQAGVPAVRLGSTPYAGYHSPGDVPAVVRRDQLGRTARVVAAFLSGH